MAQFLRDANGFCTSWANSPQTPDDGSTRVLVIQPQAPLISVWAPASAAPATHPLNDPRKPIALNETHCTTLDHDGYYEIHRAAAAGNHLLVQQILEDGVNIGLRRGHTPDAYLPDVEQIVQETLVKLGSPRTTLFYEDFSLAVGVTPLDLAVFFGHAGVVRVLLGAGVMVNESFAYNGLLCRTGMVPTPYFAFQERRNEVAEILASKGSFFYEIVPELPTSWLQRRGKIPHLIRGTLSHRSPLLRHFDDDRTTQQEMAINEVLVTPLSAADPKTLDRILNVPSFKARLAATQSSAVVMTMVSIGSAITRLMEAYNVRYSAFSSQRAGAYRARAQRRIPRLMFVLKKHGLLDQQTMADTFEVSNGVRPAALPNIQQQHKLEGALQLDICDVKALITSMALCGIRPPDQMVYSQSLLGRTLSMLDSTDRSDWKPQCIDLIKLIMKTCTVDSAVQDQLKREARRIQAKIIRVHAQYQDFADLEQVQPAPVVVAPVHASVRAYLDAGGPTYFSGAAVSAALASSVLLGCRRQRPGARPVGTARGPYAAIQTAWMDELRRILPEMRQNDIHLLNLLPLDVIRDLANYLSR